MEGGRGWSDKGGGGVTREGGWENGEREVWYM